MSRFFMGGAPAIDELEAVSKVLFLGMIRARAVEPRSGSKATRQFLHQPLGAVDGPQGLDDRAGIDRDGPRDPIVVDKIQYERLDVAVEDQSDNFVVAIDDGAPRVAADDVGRRDEVQLRVEPEPALVLRL